MHFGERWPGFGRRLKEVRELRRGRNSNVNAKDLDRYKQLLLAKRREIEAGAIGTIGAAVDQGNATWM